MKSKFKVLKFLACLSIVTFSSQAFVRSGSVAASGSSDTMTAFYQEQQALGRECQLLVARGTTEDQLVAWFQQNAARIQAQRERADALAAEANSHPVTSLTPAYIPPNSSRALQNFLTTRQNLLDARAQLHNQLMQSLPSDPTAGEVSQLQQQEESLFRQQHGGDLQLQQQRAMAIASESALQPMPVSGATIMPSGATPRLKALIKLRDTLRGEWVQLWNQNLTADPAVRDSAMQDWCRQHAVEFQQLTKLAQALSNEQ